MGTTDRSGLSKPIDHRLTDQDCGNECEEKTTLLPPTPLDARGAPSYRDKHRDSHSLKISGVRVLVSESRSGGENRKRDMKPNPLRPLASRVRPTPTRSLLGSRPRSTLRARRLPVRGVRAGAFRWGYLSPGSLRFSAVLIERRGGAERGTTPRRAIAARSTAVREPSRSCSSFSCFLDALEESERSRGKETSFLGALGPSTTAGLVPPRRRVPSYRFYSRWVGSSFYR